MGRPIFPRVLPFNIPDTDWEVSDRRMLSRQARHDSTQAWNTHTARLLTDLQSMSPKLLCGSQEIPCSSSTDRFNSRRVKNVSLTREAFDLTDRREERLETTPDYSRPEIFLSVRNSLGWIGGIAVSNMEIEFEDRNQVNINAYFLLGVPIRQGRGETIGRQWARIFRHMLNNALPMDDGRDLEIFQYNLLSSDKIRETMNSDPIIIDFMMHMRPYFTLLGDPDNLTAPVLFRRMNKSARNT